VLLWPYPPELRLKLLFKNLSILRKPFIDPVWICRPSNRKYCGSPVNGSTITRTRDYCVLRNLEPELVSFIEAFAAELGMEPDKFAGMVVTQHIAPQN
jgi:hypothetical protein